MKTVWTDERIEWLWHHRTEGHKELYKLFCEAFPEVHTTIHGVAGKRSEIGACIIQRKSDARSRPLYSEQVKKGFVKIKIAQPSTWEYKQKWVWMETHPWLYDTVKENDVFIFLDGNNRNFNPDNICKISRAELGMLNLIGGVCKDNPEITLSRIAQTKLKIAMFDLGEKAGLVVNGGGGRVFKEEKNRKAREYRKRKREEKRCLEKKYGQKN